MSWSNGKPFPMISGGRPLNVYDAEKQKKLYGWHDKTVFGSGRTELIDTYNDIVKGRLYGETKFIAPEYKYAEYNGHNTLTLENAAEKPVKGVRIQGKTVYSEDGGEAYSVTNPAVKVTGINLFDPRLWQIGKSLYGAGAGAVVSTINDAKYASSLKIDLLASQQYTFLCANNDVYWIDRICEMNENGICTYNHAFYAKDNNVRTFTWTTQQTTRYAYFRFKRTDDAPLTGDDVTALQFMLSLNTNVPYESYQSNSVTLPYTLRSNRDNTVYDMVDTYLNQYIQRITEDGDILENLVVTDLEDDCSLQSYDGITHFMVSNDNHVADVPFSVIAATNEAPTEPDPLNPFIIEHTKDLTVTVEGDGHEPHTVTIPGDLYAIPDGNGGYIARDSVDLDTMEIVRECGYKESGYTWDSSVSTSSELSANASGFRMNSTLMSADKSGGVTNFSINNFKKTSYGNLYAGYVWGMLNGIIYVNVPKTLIGFTSNTKVTNDNTQFMKMQSEKWLAENAPKIIYKLEEPVREPLNIAPLPSFYPTTVITCADENGNSVDMEMVLKQQD